MNYDVECWLRNGFGHISRTSHSGAGLAGLHGSSAMQQEKEQVALTSIAASAALTIAKAVIGFATGSLAILSEAGHSLIDLGATVITYAAVRVSGKPADEEHQYGHGKFESVSALAETALLVCALRGRDLARGRTARRRACGRRCQCLGLRRDRRVDRGRFFPLAGAVEDGKADLEPRARSRRAAFLLGSVGLGGGAGRPCRRALRPCLGRIRPRRSSSRCWSASPAGGSAAAPSIR